MFLHGKSQQILQVWVWMMLKNFNSSTDLKPEKESCDLVEHLAFMFHYVLLFQSYIKNQQQQTDLSVTKSSSSTPWRHGGEQGSIKTSQKFSRSYSINPGTFLYTSLLYSMLLCSPDIPLTFSWRSERSPCIPGILHSSPDTLILSTVSLCCFFLLWFPDMCFHHLENERFGFLQSEICFFASSSCLVSVCWFDCCVCCQRLFSVFWCNI